ncbi:MAG: hypothetical protein ABIR56_04975 [Polaromonas sp.]
MFSEHIKKVDAVPARALFGVAAGLVFLCQLAALVLVVNGQVEKAHVREAYYSSAQMEIAGCSKTYSGAARSQCIEQVNAALNPYSTYTSSPDARALAQVSQQADHGGSGGALRSAKRAVQGFMPTAFASR